MARPEWVTELRLSFCYDSPAINSEFSQFRQFWWERCRGYFDLLGFRLLVLLGADVDQVDKCGRSALFNVGFSYIESWLEVGADPNLVDVNGRTALDKALIDFPHSSREQLTRLFREYGGKTGEELKEEEMKIRAKVMSLFDGEGKVTYEHR